MQNKQQTLKESIHFSGKGLHTGLQVEMVVEPAEENYGIKFQRVDVDNQPIIDATADNVTATSRGTTLEQNGVKVTTIEHIMAALWGMGIDNALIKVNAPEAPILDGSAGQYVEAIKKAGIIEQEAERCFFEVKEKMVFTGDNGKEIVLLPDNDFSVDLTVNFNSKAITNQIARLSNMRDFPD